MPRKITKEEFIAEYSLAAGNINAMAHNIGMDERSLRRRLRRLEGEGLLQTVFKGAAGQTKWAYKRLNTLEFDTGHVIVYSDAHYWPGIPPTQAFKALVRVCAALQPIAIVANGDLIDGARIGRFPKAGWSTLPLMKDELDEMQIRQGEIAAAAPRARKFRTAGNHDQRLDRYFAMNAEQFQGLQGLRLADYLPAWEESHSVQINDTRIKHRVSGGENAVRSNVIKAGMSIVTGHLHRLDICYVRGYRDAPLWGVETGTLADNSYDGPEDGWGPFEYAEDNPTRWASGFVVLTYHKGRLLRPSFCEILFGKAWLDRQEV